MKKFMNANYITGQECWNLLQQAGFDKEFINDSFDLYYRSTQFTPRNEWKSAKFIWCIYRDYKDNYECCFQLEHYVDMGGWKRNTYPPWSVFDDKFGIHDLVLIEKE
jgi:hypothetical protein